MAGHPRGPVVSPDMPGIRMFHRPSLGSCELQWAAEELRGPPLPPAPSGAVASDVGVAELRVSVACPQGTRTRGAVGRESLQ